jgi:hypothetical protein
MRLFQGVGFRERVPANCRDCSAAGGTVEADSVT